ncbi:MAG TPA: DUF1616 domain-containing protein [Candidatus Thermoplasmatota archaeon]|nr:DUF1616 domain-containing protein [Candidatus Thermoplasmatota archaeon]
MADPLRVVVGLALALFLPGFALLALLRPHKPATVMEWAERLFLSIALSIAVLVVVSVPLVYGPWQLGGRGLFQGSASGAPILELVLGALTAGFAAGAWARARKPQPFSGPGAGEAEAHARADALARGEGSAEDATRDLYG